MGTNGEPLVRVYVDTNVLINYCNNIAADREALNYIFKIRRKEVLFTSSLAVVQTITRLQTSTKTRKAYSRDEVVKKLNKLLPKFTIVDLTYEDVKSGVNETTGRDLEDGIHFALSRKMKCDCITTNNIRDFAMFPISAIRPSTDMLKGKLR